MERYEGGGGGKKLTNNGDGDYDELPPTTAADHRFRVSFFVWSLFSFITHSLTYIYHPDLPLSSSNPVNAAALAMVWKQAMIRCCEDYRMDHDRQQEQQEEEVTERSDDHRKQHHDETTAAATLANVFQGWMNCIARARSPALLCQARATLRRYCVVVDHHRTDKDVVDDGEDDDDDNNIDGGNNGNHHHAVYRILSDRVRADPSFVAILVLADVGAALGKVKVGDEDEENNGKDNDDTVATGWVVDVMVPWTLSLADGDVPEHFDVARTCCGGRGAGATTTTALNLSRILSAEDWDKYISQTLQRRVKSHPDTAWPIVREWMRFAVLAEIPITAIITDEWMTTVTKAVQGTNTSHAIAALKILVLWASSSSSSSSASSIQNDSPVASWINKVVGDTPPTLSPLRMHVYRTLIDMATAWPDHRGVADVLLPILASWYVKETKMDGKKACLAAGLSWIHETDVVSSPSKDTATWWTAITAKPADAAVVLQQVMTMKTTAGSSSSSSSRRGSTNETNVVMIGSILSILASQKGVKQAWQSLAETAQSKKAAHADGLAALYATLVTTTETVPTWVTKIMSAGSAKVVDKNGGSSAKSTPFLFQTSCWESTVPGGGAAALAQSLALYTEKSGDTSLWVSGSSCASHALVYTIIYPGAAAVLVKAAVGKILNQVPSTTTFIVTAALDVVNQMSLVMDERQATVNATRESRENEFSSSATTPVHVPTYATLRQIMDEQVLRATENAAAAAVWKPSAFANALILLHTGTLAKSQALQRDALQRWTQKALEQALAAVPNLDAFREDFGKQILQWTTGLQVSEDGSKVVVFGSTVHEAALSLLVSIGKVASLYAPDTDDAEDSDLKTAIWAQKLCTAYVASHLSEQLRQALKDVRALSTKDVDIYLSPTGTLVADDVKSGHKSKGSAKKHLTEEEQWELQIKNELAQKKQSSGEEITGVRGSLSTEDRAIVKEQDEQRIKIRDLVEHHYCRILEGIRAIVLSDIEVGNACLPSLGRPVIEATVSNCPLLERLHGLARQGYTLLTDLASCVYEIDESVATTMSEALQIACRRPSWAGLEPVTRSDASSTSNLVNVPLPSPCDAATTVFQELDNFHDVLSGASFYFLFPIIQASLIGPRTSPGSETAVAVLNRHTELLSGEDADTHVQSIRKEMVLSLLEVLKHDRYQTFQHPSVMEVLVNCFKADQEGPGALTNTDLGPLLDHNGALGSTTCRIGAMMALQRVSLEYPKLVKNNPLVENRVWLNCFAKNEDIQSTARKAWKTLKNAPYDDESLPAPSPIYAAALTPLLNSSDESIADAAADALAHAMSYHPKSVDRNLENLCKLYIESFPSKVDSDETNSNASASSRITTLSTPKPTKKPISTGLPKKKTAKSALSIAGIGKPKAGPKKKSSGAAAALLKPKQERTLDQTDLVSQFIATPAKAQCEKDSSSKVSARLGVLKAITAVTAIDVNVALGEETLKQLTGFLMAYGLAESDDKVKSAARDTLRDVVASKGGSEGAIGFLLPQLEAVLKTGKTDESSIKLLPTDKIPQDVAASDRRKEGAVVALGSVALHLKGPENESKIDSTVDMLLVALKTPSEDVQCSVADALTKLMKKGNTQTRLETIISDLLRDCLYGDSLATRRGAAYGLSAAIKGSGIATLKKFDVVKKLEEACESGSASSKEGSLFAMELLSRRLGLLFEPYVIVLLPSLLKSFSDGSEFVREAASNTASLIMSKLSAHGVKLVMPAVLESFGESAWRTKQASIQMLGSMSHLAPKQLASALPKVVPKLTEAFSDTHPKVKSSAQEALIEISTVIRNPEIKSVSPMLLSALTDPADNTQRALEGLIATEFLHAIDAPSLALIVPILHRGLRDRGATVKRMGGLIAGNICTMINDPRDFLPYLPTLLPDLQNALLDPIPDVRNTSAKALGTLARSLGDHILPDLRPWLVQKLRDKTCSSAERSGAAQGLTEVLIASGTEAVDEVLRNELLPLSSYPEASTREGVLWMLTFLPPSMGQNFSPFIDVSLGPLVKGLSDDSENVRDVAMRAGRVLIRSHGKVHLDKILPSLEEGLEDDDHRIRLASLSLLGDLLSTIGGTSVLRGDGDTQDDIRKAERAHAHIALALGPDTRKRVLSKLYMARNDSMHAVRHSAIQIWKTVVSITARALRDILAVLVNLIVDNLASGHEERTVVAGQCLGDVVSKLGESVLPQIIPVLRKSLYEGDEHTKRGVCVGLTDVIKCSSKEQILRFLEIITKLVQDALSDDDTEVRSMASASFQSLYTLVGNQAFDEIVPSLMVGLSNDDDENIQRRALNGLTGILAVRSRELLPYIVPRLITRPISANHARALGRISAVTGATIHTHFHSIITNLILDLAEGDDGDERVDAIRECSLALCASVDSIGVNSLIGEVASKCSSDKAAIRRESCLFFKAIVTERKCILTSASVSVFCFG